MTPFSYARAGDAAEAFRLGGGDTTAYLGGGTNLVDLMRETVAAPEMLIDVTGLSAGIEETADGGLLIGAAVRNTALAEHRAVRMRYPMHSRAILAGASAQIRNMATVERKILKSLPKMARGAQSPELKAAFEKHRAETEGQIERLQQVFEIIGKPARGKTCEAIEGILAEAEEILDEYKDTVALDAGLISAAQAVEYYEITRYGTLRRWAIALGMQDAAALLDATLQEESATDEGLTALAEASANPKAMNT